MAKDVRIISARVGFLFRQDQLRLSMLTADPIIETITRVEGQLTPRNLYRLVARPIGLLAPHVQIHI